MNTPAILSLCSGYGGLDLAAEHHYAAETRWVAEIDRHAANVLAERFPDAPNLGDFTIRDWTPLAGHVDILTAGYPCQPFSHAGQRKGTDDDRHIWPEVLRAIRDLRPRRVLLENVAGHLSLGFGRVLGDLAASGYMGRWESVRASTIGAPHHRLRVFIVATNTPHDNRTAPDTDHRLQRPERPAMDRNRTRTRPAQNPRDTEHRTNWGPYTTAIRRWETILGRPAPAPMTDTAKPALNARFVEWMMGLPEGWVTDIVPNRRALKTLGNGVVPHQAIHALNIMDGSR